MTDKLQEFVSKKMYLEAATLLVDADRSLNQDDLLKIGALTDKYEEIIAKKNTFHEVLLDKIYAIIYLKDEETEDSPHRGSLQSVPQETQDDFKIGTIEALVAGLFVLEKQNVAVHNIVARLRSDFRSMIQKVIIYVKNQQEESSIASQIPRQNEEAEQSSMFAKMLNIVFEKCKNILVNHQYVCGLFEDKFNEIESKRSRKSDIHDYTQTYKIENVWEEFQKELQLLIGYYIKAPLDQRIQMNDIEEDVKSNRSKIFSFSNSSAFTTYEISDTQKFHYKTIEMGEASQYNLSSIYPIISTFCDSSIKLIDKENASDRLKKWMDNFISTTFMVNIKSDYKQRIISAKESSDAFKVRDKSGKGVYSNDENKRPLAIIAVEVYKCVKELYFDIISMPQYTKDFHQIIETIMSIYLDTIRAKIDDILKDTETGRVLKSKEWSEVIGLDPNWRKLERLYRTEFSKSTDEGSFTSSRQTRSGSFQDIQISLSENEEDEYFEQLFDLEYSWYTGTTPNGVPLKRRHMVLDPYKLGLLALIHESLHWLCSKIYQLDKPEFWPNSSAKKQQPTSQFKAFSRLKKSLSKDFSRAHTLPPISENMTKIAKKYKIMSDEALQAIFIDFRLQSCYFLDGVGKSNYVLQVEDRAPDSFCIQLNQSLSSSHQTLISYLPPAKLKYLFGKLPKLMSTILIQCLKTNIEEINRYGALKMVRNVFALQQNLSNITSFNEAPFDRVRVYYELINLTEEEIFQYISNHIKEPSNFSIQDYRTVLEVVTNPKYRTISDDREQRLRDIFSI